MNPRVLSTPSQYFRPVIDRVFIRLPLRVAPDFRRYTSCSTRLPLPSAFLSEAGLRLAEADAPAEPPSPWRGEGAAQGEPIAIGVAGPFTGPARKYGEMIWNAAQLKRDEINRRGGIAGRPIVLRKGDDQG